MFEKELFKRDSMGRSRSWKICVEKDEYWTESGLVDGKKNKSLPTKCESKNVGRSNETTPEQQAMSEALSLIEKKLTKEKYAETLVSVHEQDSSSVDVSDNNFGSVMLGKVYSEREEKEKLNYPYLQSPKLDGIRMYHNGQQMSRGHKQFFATPHLNSEIEELKIKIAEITFKCGESTAKIHPSNVITDGELYNHELKHDFEKIVSIVRTQKKEKLTEKFLKESREKIQYHIFDFHILGFDEGIEFASRWSILNEVFKICNFKYLKLVRQEYVEDEQQALDLHDDFVKQGYEGSMFKELTSLYEQKKSDKLLKLKPFFDEEFEIIGIKEGKGNWKGAAKAIEFNHESGETFEATFKGSRDRAKVLFNEHLDYIGKMATVRYDSVTKKCLPRFGRVIEIRDYE